jgi:hypothetical protein
MDWSANCKKEKLIQNCSDPPQHDSLGTPCEIGGFGPDVHGYFYPKLFMDEVRSNCQQSCNCALPQDNCNFNASVLTTISVCPNIGCGKSNDPVIINDYLVSNSTTCQLCGTRKMFQWSFWFAQLGILVFCWSLTLLTFLYLCQILWPHWQWHHCLITTSVHRRADMNQNIEFGSVSVVNEYADKVHDVSSGTEVVNVDSVLVSMNGGEVKQNRVSHPLRATKELKEMHKEMDEAEEIQLAMALSASMSASTGNQDQQGDHGGERKN